MCYVERFPIVIPASERESRGREIGNGFKKIHSREISWQQEASFPERCYHINTGFPGQAWAWQFGRVLCWIKYKDRDFVLIDESHNFRYPDTQRYKIVQQFLATGRRCCFLTATPRNKTAWDVYYQIKLFHQDDKTDVKSHVPNHKRDVSTEAHSVLEINNPFGLILY